MGPKERARKIKEIKAEYAILVKQSEQLIKNGFATRGVSVNAQAIAKLKELDTL